MSRIGGAKSLFGGKSSTKEEVKIQYHIKVNRIEGLPKTASNPIWVSWKRGEKVENHGETKKITSKDGVAILDHPFTIEASLLKDKKGYKEKKIRFTITEEKEKEKDKEKGKKHPIVLGTIDVDLSQYAESKAERSRTFPINDKSKATANLSLSFQATWLKVNGKTIVKADDAMQKEILTGLGKETVQVPGQDGDEYFLKTEQDVSEVDETDFAPTNEHDSDGEEEVSFEDDADHVEKSSVSTTTSTSTVPAIKRTDSTLSSTSDSAANTSTASLSAASLSAATSSKKKREKKDDAKKDDAKKDDDKDEGGSAEARLKKYKKKVKSLQTELDKAKASSSGLVKERDEEIKTMLKEMETIKERSKSIGNNVISDYTTQIEDLNVQVGRLKKERAEMAEQLQIEKNQNTKSLNDITQLQNQFITANANVEREQAEKKALQSKVTSLESSSASAGDTAKLEEKLDRAVAQYDKLQEELDGERATLATLQEENRSIYLQLENERLKTNSIQGSSSRLEQDNINLKEQIEHLEKTIEVHSEEISKFNHQEAEINKLKENLKEQEAERKKSEDIASNLALEVKDLNARLEQTSSSTESTADQVNELKNQLNSKQEELDSKLEELNIKQEEVDSINQEKTRLQEELSKVQEAKKELDAKLLGDVDSVNQEKESFQEELNKLTEAKKELDAKTSEVKSLQEEKQKIEDEKNELNAKLEALEAEVSQFKENENKYESKIEELNDKCLTLEKETEEKLESLTAQLADRPEPVVSQPQVNEAPTASFEEEKSEYETKITELKEKLNKYKEKNASYKEKITSYKEKIGDLEEELETAKTNGGDKEEKKDDEEEEERGQEIQEYKKKIEYLNAEIGIYKDEIEGLREQTSDYRKDTEGKHNTILEYQTMVEQLQKDLESANDEVSTAKATIVELEDKLEEAAANHNENGTSDSDEESNDELKAKIEKYKSKIRELKEEIESKEDEMSEEKVKLEETVQTLETEKLELLMRIENLGSSAAPVAVAAASLATTNENSVELENLKAKVKVLKQERDGERQNNIDLKEQMDIIGKKFSALQKENESQLQQHQQQMSLKSPSSPAANGNSDSARKELEELKNIESCVYWPELDFDRNNVPYCGASVWQMIGSIGGLSKPQNHQMLTKIVSALEKSFLALSPKSADPTVSGIEIYVSSFVPPSEETGGSFIRDLQSLALSIYSKLIAIIEPKLEKLLIDSILKPDTLIFDNVTSPAKSGASLKPGNAPDINKFLMILDSILFFLDEGKVCDVLSNQLLHQIFYFINSQITNHFLTNPKACRAALGFKVKMIISRLKEWCSQTKFKGISEQLEPAVETSNLFVIDKSVFVDIEAIRPIFQKLNLVQIKKLLESFEPDNLSPDALPTSLVKAMDMNWRQPSEQMSLPLLIDSSKKIKFE
eukprot:gene7443-8709_t